MRNGASGGAEGGAARTASAQTRPDPARPARELRPLGPPGTPPWSAASPLPAPEPRADLSGNPPPPPRARSGCYAHGRERERVIACARPGTGRRDGVGLTCSGLCACAGTRLSPLAPAVPAGNLAGLKDSGKEGGVFRLAKQWPRSSAPTEDTRGSEPPARPQGWETTPPPPGLDVTGGAGPRPGLGGLSDPQVTHPSPAEPARAVKAGSEPLRAVTALARVMGARGGADRVAPTNAAPRLLPAPDTMFQAPPTPLLASRLADPDPGRGFEHSAPRKPPCAEHALKMGRQFKPLAFEKRKSKSRFARMSSAESNGARTS